MVERLVPVGIKLTSWFHHESNLRAAVAISSHGWTAAVVCDVDIAGMENFNGNPPVAFYKKPLSTEIEAIEASNRLLQIIQDLDVMIDNTPRMQERVGIFETGVRRNGWWPQSKFGYVKEVEAGVWPRWQAIAMTQHFGPTRRCIRFVPIF